jgi:hypothetical protein
VKKRSTGHLLIFLVLVALLSTASSPSSGTFSAARADVRGRTTAFAGVVNQNPISQDLIVYPPLPWHDPICSGHRQRYTLRFANNTTQTLTNVQVSNLLPSICPGRCDVCLWDGGWPHDDCSPGAMYDGQRTVTWLLPSVVPGEVVTLYLEMRVWSSVPGGQVLENCLTVSSDQTDPQTACSQSTTLDCETPTPTATATSTRTATLVPTFTPTPTGEVTPTPTSEPTPTRTPMAAEQCYNSAPELALIYRISVADFYGYETDSASTSDLIAVTSPPAPVGWNHPDFVPDDSWRVGMEVWWDAWATLDWWIYPDASIVGLADEHGVQEGLDGTTHLIRHTFQVDAPHPDLRITHAILQMWSDNKTAWWWQGALAKDGHEGSGGQVDLFPGHHIAAEGGTYVLAIQNSNDLMYWENPQGTAFRLCVTWVHANDIAATPTPTDTAMPTATPTLTAPTMPQRVLLPLILMGY